VAIRIVTETLRYYDKDMKHAILSFAVSTLVLFTHATPLWALDSVGDLRPTATGWMGPTIAILVVIGVGSISFKSSKRTHQD